MTAMLSLITTYIVRVFRRCSCRNYTRSGIISSNSNEFNDEESEVEEIAESNDSDDEAVTISKEDLMTLQLFRNICFNIRENLEAIRSCKKVDILGLKA